MLIFKYVNIKADDVHLQPLPASKEKWEQEIQEGPSTE